MEEKRNHKRFATGLTDIKGRMLFTNKVKVIDVSGGGMFVKADRRFEIGREYSLKIEYEDKVLSVDGIVIWSALGERGEGPYDRTLPIYRAGIKFTNVAPEKINELIGYIGPDKLGSHDSGEQQKGGGQRLATGLHVGVPEETILERCASYRLKKISLRGMLIESEREMAIETRLPMELSLSGNRRIFCWGRVAYCLMVETENASLFNIGIEFIALSENDREKLKQALRRLDKNGDNASCFVSVQRS